jgi:nucleoside-diphosphate-sugar epimerase
MKSILITGAAGNIGSSLASSLCKKGYNVVAVDNLTTGNREKLKECDGLPNFDFISCDANSFNDISGVFYRFQFDYVFHFAAVVGVQRTIDNPISVLNDIKGIENILTLSKNTRVKRVFYSSSSEVYGEPVSLPQNENTTPLNSRLPYAVVKNIGEAYLKSFKQEFDLDFTIFRFFNTYGPNQSEDFVISKFISKALRNEDITIYGDGSQTRTFCYIDDNIDTMIMCMENNHFVNDILNIGSGVENTILELANTIVNITGSGSKIVFLPPLKDGDMTRRMPDNHKMLSILNRSLIPVEDGISLILSIKK